MQEFCIVANGPCLEKDLIIKAIAGKKVLALDGAASILLKYSIKPNLILGDFDSLDEEIKKYYGIKSIATFDSRYVGNHDVLIIPAFDQNYTDLEKAIWYCDNKSKNNITIIGATGGREDHHEALKIVLKKYYKPYRNIVSHSNYGSMCYVENEKMYFYGKSGDHCGFVLQGLGSVVSEGLQYQCQGHLHSISNKMLGKVASFSVSGGALLFLPLQL